MRLTIQTDQNDIKVLLSLPELSESDHLRRPAMFSLLHFYMASVVSLAQAESGRIVHLQVEDCSDYSASNRLP